MGSRVDQERNCPSSSRPEFPAQVLFEILTRLSSVDAARLGKACCFSNEISKACQSFSSTCNCNPSLINRRHGSQHENYKQGKMSMMIKPRTANKFPNIRGRLM
ncbi:hypothetical protein COLO4_13098 [Corchorus olitorius]|uniref:F-box domain-containing protein n=1 Tax=Corchorus olitorius TaxID=93759 RepID=A0A1R3JY64_9ROSI|nr:hypothetical protein COLO4_13098 [Corchorus olitorius]